MEGLLFGGPYFASGEVIGDVSAGIGTLLAVREMD